MNNYLKTALLSSAIVASGSVAAAGMVDSDKETSKPMQHDQGMMQHDMDKSTATPEFNTLDADSDGYLSRSEASVQENLDDKWDTLDKNNDRRLDRAEFSAFETEDLKLDADTDKTVPAETE